MRGRNEVCCCFAHSGTRALLSFLFSLFIGVLAPVSAFAATCPFLGESSARDCCPHQQKTPKPCITGCPFLTALKVSKAHSPHEPATTPEEAFLPRQISGTLKSARS